MSISLTSRIAAARGEQRNALPERSKAKEAAQTPPAPAPERPVALPRRRAALPLPKSVPPTSPPAAPAPGRHRQSALPPRPEALVKSPTPEAEVPPSAPASELQKAYGLQPRKRKPKSAPRENTKEGKPRRVRSDKGMQKITAQDLQVLEWIVLARYVNREQIAEYTGRSAYGTRHLTDRYLRNGWTEQRVISSGRYVIWVTKAALALLPHLTINPATRPKPEKALAHYFAVGSVASKIERGAIRGGLFDTTSSTRLIYDEQMRRCFWKLTAGAGLAGRPLTRDDFPPAQMVRRTDVDVEEHGHGFLLRTYDRDGVVKSTHRPDLAVLRTDGEQFVIGIEVERQAKTIAEYEEILSAYKRSEVYDQVLYIYKDEVPLIERRVQAAAEKLGLGDFLKVLPYNDIAFHAEKSAPVETKNGQSYKY